MNLKLTTIALATVLAAGCAGSGAPNTELEQARVAVNRAEQNPRVVQLAPVPLADAREALARADVAWKAGKDKREVEHLAYIARRQALTAEARARVASAEKAAELAGGQRSESIIESRERELARTREALATSKEKTTAAETQAQTAEEITEMERLRATQAEATLESKREQETQREEQTAQAKLQLEKLQTELAELKPRMTDRGMVLTLQDVLFDTGKAHVKPGADRSLDRLARFLKENPGYRVMIEGHTDSRGDDEFNQDLSERRADSVRREMVRRGLAQGTMDSAGFGESRPIASNDSPGGRQINRRVEFVILEGGSARNADDLHLSTHREEPENVIHST